MNFEEKIKANINNDLTNISRQQRRQMERSAKKFDRRNMFTKSEVEKANAAAYEYGKQIALQAAAKVLGLGEKRLARIEEEANRLEYQTFVKPFDDLKGASADGK
jgi:hypothetical protein